MGVLCADAIHSERHARAGIGDEIVVFIHTSMVSKGQVAWNSHTSVSQATAGLRMKTPSQPVHRGCLSAACSADSAGRAAQYTNPNPYPSDTHRPSISNHSIPSRPTSDLTDILPSFHRPALGPLLAHQPLNLTLARRASVLGLLCLLLALRSGLLFLAFLDR